MTDPRRVNCTRPEPPRTDPLAEHLARRYGYMPPRPPSNEERIAYLEDMVEWLADQLESRAVV